MKCNTPKPFVYALVAAYGIYSAAAQSLVAIPSFFIELTPGFTCSEAGGELAAIRSAAQSCSTSFLPTCGFTGGVFLREASCRGSSGVTFNSVSLFLTQPGQSATTERASDCIQQAMQSPGCLSAFQNQVSSVTGVSSGVNTPSPTMAPIVTPSPISSAPVPRPTRGPTVQPSASPIASPTRSPTRSPTASPTRNPSSSPVASPTLSPTQPPTTLSPTRSPIIGTRAPVIPPTASPIGATSSPSEPTSTSIIRAAGPDDDKNKGAVIGASVAGGLALVVLLALLARRNRRASSEKAIPVDASLDENELRARQTGLSNKDSLSPRKEVPVSSSLLGRVMGGPRRNDEVAAADSHSLASLSFATSNSIGAAMSVESFEEDRREQLGGHVKKDMMGSPLDIPPTKRPASSPRRKYDQVGLYCSSAMEDIESGGNATGQGDTSDEDEKAVTKQEEEFYPDPSWDPDDTSGHSSADEQSDTVIEKGLLRNSQSKTRYDLTDVQPVNKERRANTPTKFLR